MPRPIQYGQRSKMDVKQQQATPAEGGDADSGQGRRATLMETVLNKIGRPDDLIEVCVRDLWDVNHYRVNIYRDVKGMRCMTDSFFIYMVDDGIISTPPMDRRYYDDMLEKIHDDSPAS